MGGMHDYIMYTAFIFCSPGCVVVRIFKAIYGGSPETFYHPVGYNYKKTSVHTGICKTLLHLV